MSVFKFSSNFIIFWIILESTYSTSARKLPLNDTNIIRFILGKLNCCSFNSTAKGILPMNFKQNMTMIIVISSHMAAVLFS